MQFGAFDECFSQYSATLYNCWIGGDYWLVAFAVLIGLWLLLLAVAYWRDFAPVVGEALFDLIFRPLRWLYRWALLRPFRRVFGRRIEGRGDPEEKPDAEPAADEASSRLFRKARSWMAAQRARARERGFEYWLDIITLAISVASFSVVLLLVASAIRGPSGDTSTEILTYRIGLATLLGALTLPLLAHRARVNERQTQVAEAGHITDRIIKATELLGAVKQVAGEGDGARYEPNIEVRLGAIFTLERVAKESRTDCATIMETFAAYVRENLRRQREAEEAKRAAEHAAAKREGPLSETPAEDTAQEQSQEETEAAPPVIEPREDVLAVLRVINRRNDKPKKWEGEQAFEWAEMSLQRTDLRSLFPRGSAAAPRWRLPGADLRKVNLEDAELKNTKLAGAKLQNANLSSADLSGACLRKADLSSANMSFSCFVDADLREAVIAAVTDSGPLAPANLHAADLTAADLRASILWRANFSEALLERANLRGAHLESADLSKAELSGADLREANLDRANFESADMSHVDLGCAIIRGANFVDADLDLGSLSGAKFSLGEIGEPPGDAPQGLSQSQLESAFGDKRTADQVRSLGREDLSPPEHWHREELTDPDRAQEEWRKWRERRTAQKMD